MPIDVKMPQLGESVTEGTIGRWLKQPGEAIEEFEPLLEVTTDKVDTEVPATIKGMLSEILVPEGETVRVGTVIARLIEASEAASNSVAPALPVQAIASRAPISPVVARLANEYKLNLDDIQGSGGGGRVTKKDVEAFLAQRSSSATATPTVMSDGEAVLNPQAVVDPAAAPTLAPPVLAPTAPGYPESPPLQRQRVAVDAAIPERPTEVSGLGPDDELVPLTPMRRAIAQHMVHSKQTAPHVTTVMEVDLHRVVAHRARHRADFERQGVKLTFTAYFVEATVAALREVGIVNSSYAEGGIVQHHRIHVGVAVALPDGLIVPVIKDADDKSLLGLARAVNDLAQRARLRRLLPDEVQGGTFSITNHGVGGSLFAMPIINQPQAAILGVGAIEKRAVVVSENGMDALAIRPMCYLSLTLDHRVIDGATGDAFLTVAKRILENYSTAQL
ncbi:MAG: 2-oxo acid dehydrogenase subunit E2 [Herpetosiphonaceae bacterium]|nr:2-oxo acid dehydrogenase subunit E2 [Herpetosiphonaceae bacterium]